MSDFDRLSELYRLSYEGAISSPDDGIHHQLDDALGVLMNVSGELDEHARIVAYSAYTSAINRFIAIEQFPSFEARP